jgi:hypothetical protein
MATSPRSFTHSIHRSPGACRVIVHRRVSSDFSNTPRSATSHAHCVPDRQVAARRIGDFRYHHQFKQQVFAEGIRRIADAPECHFKLRITDVTSRNVISVHKLQQSLHELRALFRVEQNAKKKKKIKCSLYLVCGLRVRARPARRDPRNGA